MSNIHNYLRVRQLGDSETLPFPASKRDPADGTPKLSDHGTIEATLAAVEDLSWKLEDLAREFKCCGYFDDDDDDDRPRAA